MPGYMRKSKKTEVRFPFEYNGDPGRFCRGGQNLRSFQKSLIGFFPSSFRFTEKLCRKYRVLPFPLLLRHIRMAYFLQLMNQS